MEDDLVFAHRAEVLDTQFTGHLIEIAHRHGLQLGDIERIGDAVLIGRGLGPLVLARRWLWWRRGFPHLGPPHFFDRSFFDGGGYAAGITRNAIVLRVFWGFCFALFAGGSW